MELELQHQTLDGYYPVYHTLQGQEETQESIVPDAFPDISRIVSATGQVCLKEKITEEGSARLTGTVYVTVLYIPESEEGVRALNIPIPFQCVKDCPRIHPGMPVQTLLSPIFSDARLINPRKLLVRSNILCEITVYSKKSDDLVFDAVCGQKDGVEKKLTRYTCHMISEVAEKTFVFSDVLRPSASRPDMEELLYCRAELGSAEGKVIGAKLVCKGELRLSVLYRNGTKISRADFDLPYSQVFELTGKFSESTAELFAVLKNMDCRIREGELEVSAEVLLQSNIWVQSDLTLMSDVYCTAAPMEVEYTEYALCAAAELASQRETARQFCPSGIPGKEVLDCCVTVENLAVSGRECSAQLNADILYLSEDNALCGVNYTIPVACTVPDDCDCRCRCRALGAVSAVPVTEGFEVRAEMEFSWSATKTVQAACVASVRESGETGGTAFRPSVVIRRMGGHESLWDIAKSCNSTVKDICSANDLLSEHAPEGTMLLIPTRRT